jgi:hypothetical protein
MFNLQVVIDTWVPGVSPEDTEWEQHLLGRILRDALDTAGYADADMTVEIMGKTSPI